jgi:hypothetical protein
MKPAKENEAWSFNSLTPDMLVCLHGWMKIAQNTEMQSTDWVKAAAALATTKLRMRRMAAPHSSWLWILLQILACILAEALQRGFDAKDITGFFRCHRSVCQLVFFYNAVKSYMFSRKKSLSKECSICREDLMRRTLLDSTDAIDPCVCLFSFLMQWRANVFSRKKSLSKECSICREDLMRRTLPDSLDAIDPSVCLLVFLSMKSSNVLAKGMLILLIGYRCEDHGFLILDFNRSVCSSVFVLLCSERAMYSRTKRSKELLKA